MKNKFRKKISFLVVFMIGIMWLYMPSFMATTNLNIVSDTEITVKAAQKWAESREATETFVSLAEKYWKLSKEHGNVNPAIAYAQAAIETNFGHFTGKVSEDYYNTCGMKTSDGTKFNKFDSWDDGISAQLDHLALYAGAEGYPRSDTKDTRHFKYLFGSSKTLENLGISWAESEDYGKSITRLYDAMKTYIKSDVIKIESGNNIDKNNSKIIGNVYSQNKIVSVKILVDDKQVCALSKLYEDDNKNYIDYLNKESKFAFDLDYSNYDGKHKIKIKVVHEYGKDSEYTYDVNITSDAKKEETNKKLPTLSSIDNPRSNNDFNGNKITVRGWAISGDGINKIEVYLDGDLVNTIKTGGYRPDVKRAYPDYNDDKCGYSTSVDIKNYLEHRVVQIKVYGNNGSVDTTTRRFSLKSYPNRMVIDDPSESEISTSSTRTLKVRGWALSNKKIKSIDVLFNGNRYTSIDYGKARPDVNRVFPQYRNNYSGFEGYVELDNIIAGDRELTVRVNLDDGSSFSSTKDIRINKKPFRLCLDNPADGSRVDNNALVVRGWSLADSGIQEIKVYVNNVFKGNAVYGSNRPDVNRVFPGYNVGDNSGYNLTVNIGNLNSGIHKVKVVAIAKDGSQTSVTKSFKRGNVKSKLIVVDAGHGGYDSGAPSYFNNRTYLEKDINLSVAKKLKAKLEDKGFEVVMTRNTDVFVDLVPRSDRANNLDADFFVSIHQDSFDNPNAKGTTAYYTTKVPDKGYWAKDRYYKFSKSREVAQKVVNNICSSIGTYSRGVIDQSLSVTRNTDMPSILVECGFISNYSDCMIISSNNGQDKIANAIANAIDNSF